jgi:RNA polymerase sigma-70 factor (ECF subfamily)
VEDLERLSDSELVDRARQGDEEAFRVLSDRYRGELLARIQGRLGAALRRKVAASDVMQEALLGAFEGLDTFEFLQEDSFKRWLGTIVEHKIEDVFRHHFAVARRDSSREVTRSARITISDFPKGGPSPSQVSIGEELRVSIAEALDKLPPDHERAIRLVQQEGMTMREAAEAMGRKPAAMRQLYCRALGRLERILGIAGGVHGGRRGPTC